MKILLEEDVGSILIVSNNTDGFLENSVYEGLTKANVVAVKAVYNDESIDQYLFAAELVLVVASDAVDIHTPAIVAFKQKCIDYNKNVSLYAEPDQIESLKNIFPQEVIVAEYPRPIEVEELVSKIQKLIIKIEDVNRKKTILVVDDSGPMLRTIMGWLEDTYTVVLANSATRAFAAIEKGKPDLILLDYEMPICSGAQFLEMLRGDEENKDIPVIFLTAKGDAETVKTVLALKPEGYILKTSPEEKLLTTIKNFFAI